MKRGRERERERERKKERKFKEKETISLMNVFFCMVVGGGVVVVVCCCLLLFVVGVVGVLIDWRFGFEIWIRDPQERDKSRRGRQMNATD